MQFYKINRANNRAIFLLPFTRTGIKETWNMPTDSKR